MKELWVPLSGAIAQQRKVDTIANNVANANTPGFKKDKLVFKEYLTALEKGAGDINLPRKEWAPEDFYHTQGGDQAKVQVAASFTVFEQGQLTPTGNPLDIAINGQGFLEVLTPNGIRFTRRGNLTISKEGNLVTDQGFPILSKLDQAQLQSQGGDDSAFLNPADRMITIPKGRVAITNDGSIYTNGNPLAQLSLVEFRDPHALRKEGNSLFINNENANLVLDDVKSAIHQGFIEGSNVNAMEEMSDLIKANRHFESIQRAIKTYDNISGKAVNDILTF